MKVVMIGDLRAVSSHRATCTRCARTLDAYAVQTILKNGDGRIESERGISCREVIYRRVLDYSYYFDKVKSLIIEDLPVFTNPIERDSSGKRVYGPSVVSLRAATALFNGFMLGLIKRVETPAVLDIQERSLTIPAEIGNNKYEVYGPFLSVALQGFKSQPNITMTDRLIQLEKMVNDGDYSAANRATMLGLAVGALWIDFNAATGGRDYYFQTICKEVVMYYSLGGLDKMMGKNINKIGCYPYRGNYPRTNHLTQCFHQHTITYNGSNSFYAYFFNRRVDARTVSRFISRPHKLSTAKSYIGGSLNHGAPYDV